MPSSWGARSGGRYGRGYDRFRTGLTYRQVRSMLWVADPDPSRWRYKRRHTVLGFWHQLKLALWFEMERRTDELEAASARLRLAAGGGDESAS